MRFAAESGCQVKETAGSLLTAIASGDLGSMATVIGRAKALTGSCPESEEQQELLAAVADHIESSLARSGRGFTGGIDGLECDLRLLRHLAFELN